MRSGSCPRQQTSLPEPSRSMWRAILTLLPIASAFILLPAIAFASPPDPSWIPGIYDGADGDDIVNLVYETSAAKTAAPAHVGPLPCLLEISLESLVRSAPGNRFTRGPRAPPARCYLEFASVFNSLPPPASGTESPIALPSITAFRLFSYGDLPPLGARHRYTVLAGANGHRVKELR
jgi:hypothetical protein